MSSKLTIINVIICYNKLKQMTINVWQKLNLNHWCEHNKTQPSKPKGNVLQTSSRGSVWSTHPYGNNCT